MAKPQRNPTLVIAVTPVHAYVAYVGWDGTKAAAVRDALRKRHAGSDVRFHCAPSTMPRWTALEANLIESAQRSAA